MAGATRRTRFLIAIVILALTLAAVWKARVYRVTERNRLLLTKAMGGPVALECVSQTLKATVQRVYQVSHHVTSYEDPRLLYDPDQHPIALPLKDVRKLADLLTAPQTYYFSDPKVDGLRAYIPYYGVYVSFIHGEQQVDVWLTLFCTDALFAFDDRVTGHLDFSPREAEVMEIIQRAFPDDDEIRKWRP